MHAPSREWNAYGGAPDQSRYSSLDQINRTNVQSLRVARTFDTGETGGLQTQPIVVVGTLYGLTPNHKAFALDAIPGVISGRSSQASRAAAKGSVDSHNSAPVTLSNARNLRS
jgi:glucose dehydrogenase